MTTEEQTALLREMRDLLRIMAEPAIAQRDKRLQNELSNLVGNSLQKRRAVLAMDGSRTQTTIRSESGMDGGNLSRFVKSLRGAGLITADEKQPKLTIRIPPHFFDGVRE